MSTDATSETKLLIDHRIISLHPNGPDLTTVFALFASVTFIEVGFGDELSGCYGVF